MTQFHEAHYQDNAADGVIAAAIGLAGATKQNGGAGDLTSLLRVAGPNPTRPYALRLGTVRSGETYADYVTFPTMAYTTNNATFAIICKRTAAVGSYGGYMMSWSTPSNYMGLISPYNTTDGLGYYYGTTSGAHQTDRRLRVPLDEWVVLFLRIEPTHGFYGIMDLRGFWHHAANVETHAAVAIANGISIGWGGFTYAARYAPIDVCASGAWDEPLSIPELEAWVESQVGALGEQIPTIPIASGSASAALALLSGTAPRATILSDSTGYGLADGLTRALCGQAGGPYGIPNRYPAGWSVNSIKAGVSASDTTTDSGTTTAAKVHRWTFDGNPTGSGGATTRTINSAPLGSDGYFASRDEYQRLYGRDLVQRAILLGRSLLLRVPVYLHPDGATNNCAEITLDADGVEIATSAPFAGYAATAGWVYKSLTVPPESLPVEYTTLTARLNVAANITTEAGKVLISSGFGCELIDPALSNGALIHCLTQGGAAAADEWSDPAFCSDVQFALLGLCAPQLIISHGLNQDDATITAADHRDALLTLIDRYRVVVPNGHVHLMPPYSVETLQGGYSGGEDWRNRGAYLCVEVRQRVNHYNIGRALPEREILLGTARKAWSDNAIDHYFHGGDLTQDGGMIYMSKTNHIKTAASLSPASDTTNWASTGVTTATLDAQAGFTAGGSPAVTWHNTINHDDTVHGHPQGYLHAALAFVSCLQALVGVDDTAIGDRLATIEADVAAALDDTAELQTDWANGGRLDLLLDSTVANSAAAALNATAAASQTLPGTLQTAAEAAIVAQDVATGDDVAIATPTPIAPTSIVESRTWHPGPSGHKSGEVVTVGRLFSGTLACVPELNPDADVDTFDAVTIVGPEAIEITATNLTVTADGRRVNFDVPSLTTAGTYTVTVYVSTKDGQSPPMECVLIVE